LKRDQEQGESTGFDRQYEVDKAFGAPAKPGQQHSTQEQKRLEFVTSFSLGSF
jgi:hypothetical protein